MSPSGAELLRQVKSRIEEVDPSEVDRLLDEGVAIVDVREQRGVRRRAPSGRPNVPRGHLESRIEGAVPDRSTQVDPVLRLGQPLGLRRAHAPGGHGL